MSTRFPRTRTRMPPTGRHTNEPPATPSSQSFPLASPKQISPRQSRGHIDPYDIHEADEGKRKFPSTALCPQSTEQLQQVLRIANQYAIPL
ncbi:hypothetical protein VTK56DRAFT_2068 [Thermocarpiscus australiensis]